MMTFLQNTILVIVFGSCLKVLPKQWKMECFWDSVCV